MYVTNTSPLGILSILMVYKKTTIITSSINSQYKLVFNTTLLFDSLFLAMLFFVYKLIKHILQKTYCSGK